MRGELVVEPITDSPAAVFAAGRRIFAGDSNGDISPDRTELHIAHSSPFKGGMIVAVDEIRDRNTAELWRDRYLLLTRIELEPPREDEVYLHDLPGMRVVDVEGGEVGVVTRVYEVPQGVMLDVKRECNTVLIPFAANVVTEIDAKAGVIRVDPPAGLLD